MALKCVTAHSHIMNTFSFYTSVASSKGRVQKVRILISQYFRFLMMKIKTSFIALIVFTVCCIAKQLGPINYVFIHDDCETSMKNPEFSKFRDFIRETFQVGNSDGDTYEARFVCVCECPRYWNSINLHGYEFCSGGMILCESEKNTR